MTRAIYLVRIEEHGDHVHVYGVPPHLEVAVGTALALEKAEKAEPPDPRWPQFERILDGSLSPWDAWLEWLLGELGRLGLRRGRNPVLAEQIQQRLREHETGVIAATTGSTVDAATATALVRRGALVPTYPTTAPVPAAFALGLGSNPDEVRAIGATHEPRQPRNVMELGAMSFARDRAAAYMRRPVDALHRVIKGEISGEGIPLDTRDLTPDERAILASEVQTAVADKASAKQLERRLRDAVAGHPTLTNDMERVARTELANALNHGAYTALKAKLRPGEDPEVYRLVSPLACTGCRRVWGPPSDPVRYRLSYVEAREAAGGNYGLPESQWGPVLGTMHPRCLCPPVATFDPLVFKMVRQTADEIKRGV